MVSGRASRHRRQVLSDTGFIQMQTKAAVIKRRKDRRSIPQAKVGPDKALTIQEKDGGAAPSLSV